MFPSVLNLLRPVYRWGFRQWDTARRGFRAHLKEAGESYTQHLWFTMRMSVQFVFVGIVALFHGLFPFLCTRTASRQVERLYHAMKTRAPKSHKGEGDRRIIPFPRPKPLQPGEQSIGIVGGGFSGTMVLANLIRQANGPLTIHWFESGSERVTGVAYGTSEPSHLLNVRAERMGAFADAPDGFWHWLQTSEGKEQAAAYPQVQDAGPDSYLPRELYGAYLRHLLQQSLEQARQKGILVHAHTATVVDAWPLDANSHRIVLAADMEDRRESIVVDAVALATGNLPPRRFSFQPGLIEGARNYVADVWSLLRDDAFLSALPALSADTEVVIIGTGLTMADAVLSLKSRGFKGTITAISRNGWLPAVHHHTDTYPAWGWVMVPDSAPDTALGLLRGLRAEVRRAAQTGHDWRSVVDSLRPVTQILWKRLGPGEKRRFLKRLFTLWNIHRHRMAPEVHATLKAMQVSGALKILPGTLYYVGSDQDGLTVAYRKRGTNRVETLRPALVLNCTGPEYDIAVSDHKLLRNLRDRGLITVGPLRIGIELTAGGTAKGVADEAIFPLGTLLVGELLECTAVPELRQQAHAVAAGMVNRLTALRMGEDDAHIAMAQWI